MWACADGAQFSVPSALVNAPAHTNRTVVLLFVPSLTARQRIFYFFFTRKELPIQELAIGQRCKCFNKLCISASCNFINDKPSIWDTAKEEGWHGSYTDVQSSWMSQANGKTELTVAVPKVFLHWKSSSYYHNQSHLVDGGRLVFQSDVIYRVSSRTLIYKSFCLRAACRQSHWWINSNLTVSYSWICAYTGQHERSPGVFTRRVLSQQ